VFGVSEITVVDNQQDHRFEVEVDGHLGELVYRLDGQRLVLLHTEVADELEGQGVGSELVRAAVARAAAESLTIVPNCPFARSWLERHPQELTGVSVAW
jgi:predicted GNAT family acetyltransferase